MNILANKGCDEISKIVYKATASKATASYIYFSDNDRVKFNDISQVQFEDCISVPQVDILQSIRALCLARDGISSAVYSPFYESRYLPYPSIISAINLLSGIKNSFYLVIGSKNQWQTVLKNVYCHGNLGNHPLSKNYGFRDILNIKTKGDGFKGKSSKAVRWVFSGFSNSDLWEELKDVALIIVDMVTGSSSKLDETYIGAILSYSKKIATPVVFFIKSSMGKSAKYLKENGVKILAPPSDILGPTTFVAPQGDSFNINDMELKAFLADYNLRSIKIHKNGLNKLIEIRITEDNEYFIKFYRKYSELISSLRKFDLNYYGRRASFRARVLYDSLMEFTGNVSKNINFRFGWISHPIGPNRDNLNDAIWNLSDRSQTIAKELIYEADSIMRNFETKDTPKGESLSKLMLSYGTQNKTMIILGKHSAMDGFFLNTFHERASLFEQYLVELDQLEKSHPSDIMILLGPVYGWNKTKLLTSCSSKIIMLNYSWEKCMTEKSIKEIEEFYPKGWFTSNVIDFRTNDKPATSIKISYSETGNHEDLDVNETSDETQGENLIYDPLFSEPEDLFEEQSEEDIDEYFSSLNAISKTNESSESQKLIVFIESKKVVIPENRRIVLVKENRAYLIEARRLKLGDRILITKDFSPKSLSNFVWEIMERKLGINRKTHPGNEWREKLKQYINEHPGTTYAQIFEKLKQVRNIGIRTPTAIYFWLESYDIIGPQDFETLEAIAKLVNSEDKLKEWWEGIKYIRRRHSRMIRHLWKVFAYTTKELKEKSEEDYVVDPVLGIKISEISRLVHFATITESPIRVDGNA